MAVATGAFSAEEQWRRLATEDFIIVSNASEKDVAEFAVGYAGFRQAFRSFFVGPGQQLPATTILLFRKASEYEARVAVATCAESRTICSSAEYDGHPFLSLAVDGDRKEALRTAFEFDTFWGLGRLGYGAPLWASQGAGGVFSTLEIKNGYCTVGIRPGPFPSFRKEELHWPHFFEITTASPEYAGPYAQGRFHSQAWALMHWVLLEEGSASERLSALCRAARENGGMQGVLLTMKVSENELTDAIVRHFKAVSTRRIPFDEPRLRAGFKMETVSAAQGRALAARLAYLSGKLNEGDKDLEIAKGIAPNSPEVLEVQALRELKAGTNDAGLDLCRRAVAAGSRSPDIHLALAEARLSDTLSASATVATRERQMDEVLAEIRKTLELEPGYTRAYLLLGRAFCIAPTAHPEWVAELSKGITEDSAAAILREQRLILCQRLKMEEQVLQDAEYLAMRPDLSVMAHRKYEELWLRGTIERDLFKVDSLVQEGRFADARSYLETAKTSRVGKRVPAGYARIALFIAEQEDWVGLSALRRAERWDDLDRAAREFLETFPKSKHAAEVQALQKEAEAHTVPSSGT